MNIIYSKKYYWKSLQNRLQQNIYRKLEKFSYKKLKVPDPKADTSIQINTLRNLLGIYTDMWAKEKGGGRTQWSEAPNYFMWLTNN
jgi:hypothetical protein